jgi:hypothetical protein
LLIAFAQQNLAAQIGDNGGPAFAFHGIEGFQRGIRLLQLQLNASKTHIDNRFQVIIRRGRQPLLKLLFSVLQIVLINKLLPAQRSKRAVGVFAVSRKFLRRVQRFWRIRFERGNRIFISQRRASGGILLMGGPVAPANQRANPKITPTASALPFSAKKRFSAST